MRSVALCLALACSLSAQRAADFEGRVAASLERARPVLLQHLRLQRGGVLGLVCLAAVHDEVPLEDRRFRLALDRVSRTRLTGTYDLALRLMLMAEIPTFPRRDTLIAKDTKRLLKRRLRGGFTYAKRYESWDLSNTQYAALGLRAAVALGQRIDPVIWKEMALVVMDAQAEDGGFPYTKRHRRHRPYASMTVAGIAVLQICKRQLGADAPDGIGAALERGWKWMAKNRYEIGSFDALSCFYFHYGLERAAILSGVTEIEGMDWYRKGGEMLLERQLRSGAWRSFKEIRPGALPGEGSAVDTAFAILFLRRKFRADLVPDALVLTGPRGFGTLTDNASAEEIDRAVEAVIERGRTALPEVLVAMRSEVVPQRIAAGRALEELTGEQFGYQPTRPPEDSGDAIKAAELWWLKSKK